VVGPDLRSTAPELKYVFSFCFNHVQLFRGQRAGTCNSNG
jgi:hypothetical protein